MFIAVAVKQILQTLLWSIIVSGEG